MRERTTEATNPIEQEFLSVIREYERVIYKVCYLYTNLHMDLPHRPEHVYQLFPQRKECTGNRHPHPRSGLDDRGT